MTTDMDIKALKSEYTAAQNRFNRLMANGKNSEGTGALRKIARKMRHLKEEIAKNEE